MPKIFKKIIPYEMKKLGAYLKQLRKEANLSLRDVTRECGVTPSYLLKIEKGDSFSTINIHTLLKLSKFYKIPMGAFLKEAGLVDNDEYDLPDFPQYLRAKYHLSVQAIRDLEMAKEIVEKKYKK
jgi:transcriptional regulator with XRE-family HTH domain